MPGDGESGPESEIVLESLEFSGHAMDNRKAQRRVSGSGCALSQDR